MPGIKVVLFVVRCTQSLLFCEDLPTDLHVFRNTAECQSAKLMILDNHRNQLPLGAVVMGTCRNQIAEPARREIAANPDPVIDWQKVNQKLTASLF